MKKSNTNYPWWQQKIDAFWRITLINFLPQWITPNLLSLIRLLTMPIILICFFYNQPFYGFWLFIFSVLLDSLDGAIARTRKQFTATGLWLDPLADKLLIIGVIIFLIIFSNLPAKLLIAIVGLELFLILISIIAKIIFQAQLKPSHLYGKLKMIFQSLAVILAIVDYYIIKQPYYFSDQFFFLNLQNIIIGLLFFSLILQILSIFSYFKKNKS